MIDASEPLVFIGLISGTSGDGIDAALVQFDVSNTRVIDAKTFAFPPTLAQHLAASLAAPHEQTVATTGKLHHDVGLAFADAANALREAHPDLHITAVASHGQTLFHAADASSPFTLQVGDPAIIAARTGLPVVADFRSADLAVGGQGAPLAPLFHETVLPHDDETLAIINLGGIANLSLIRPDEPTIGFDTGPANTLMDVWAARQWDLPFDANGEIAASGSVIPQLLAHMLKDAYFARPFPKSTGREYFNLEWLLSTLAAAGLESPSQQRNARRDIMATLSELTVTTLASALADCECVFDSVLICGGGARNATLMTRLKKVCAPASVSTTAERGVDPDYVEAALFAWLGWKRWHRQSIDSRAITGATQRIVAGGIHLPPAGEADE
ncbi:MAG: anhydro-N-acetylmuramic acid kinase [Pseudomonadota bacterium]